MGAGLPLQHCAAWHQRHADGDQIVSETAKGVTPSQTVGPYFAYGLTPGGKYEWNDAFSNNLVTPDASGERIRVEGRVFDGDGALVPDCMLEIWQAGAQGRFSDPADKGAAAHPQLQGFGPLRTRRQWRLCFRYHQAGAGRRSRRQAAGAASAARSVRA